MNDDYIDKFGNKKEYAGSDHSEHYSVPLTMGILSFLSFAVYFWSAFHARSVVMCIIYFVPILSIIGLIFSFVTRSARYEHHKIWLMGLISCVLSLVLYFFIFLGTMAALAQR